MERTNESFDSCGSNFSPNHLRVNRRLDKNPTGFELYYDKTWVQKLFPGAADPETLRKKLKRHVEERNQNTTERLRVEREKSIRRRFHPQEEQEQQETSGGSGAGPSADSQASVASGSSDDDGGIRRRWRGSTKFKMAMRMDGESRRERQTINSEESRREFCDEFNAMIRTSDRMFRRGSSVESYSSVQSSSSSSSTSVSM